ncbi:MAG: branched-chain-amino-acid transaminase [Spirochaetales bacterium]|nr:branched-chain-amino-acid transaminase [Spirochaetales bacterium]
MKVWLDGKLVNKEEAKISVWDHGLLYGDGLFEGMRIYSGKVFKLEEHMERLYQGAHVLNLEIPYSREALAAIVLETVAANDRRDGYIRLLVTRGAGTLGIDPAKCPKASVVVIVDGIQLYPEELYTAGIPIVTAATRRLPGDVFDPRVKSLNYLTNIMAKMEATRAGCPEAVMLTREGYIAECTADNIFIYSKGVLKTPAAHLGILEGITRATIMELAADAGIPVEEGVYNRTDLYLAEEVFLTGSGAEIIPVTEIDGRKIGEGTAGPVSGKLRKLFQDLIK